MAAGLSAPVPGAPAAPPGPSAPVPGAPAAPPGPSAPVPGSAPPAPGGVTHHGRRRTVVRWTVEAVVLGGAALFVVERAGSSVGQVGATFDHLHWHWLFVSVAAECGSIVALSWLQQRLLRVGNVNVRVTDLLPVTAASNAVAQSLPGGVLFAEGYSFRQYQRLGAGKALGVWAELSAGALASAGLAAVAVAGAVVVGSGLRLQLLPGLVFVLAGALVACALFRRAPLLSTLISRVMRFSERVLPARLWRHLRSAEAATRQMANFRPSAGLWAACLGAAMINWGLDAVVLVMGLLTVGGPVPWRGVLLCYAAAQLLVELPITPGGLGLVEGGLVEVLTRFHVPVSRATAGTLMYRAVSYWLLLLIGWAAALWLAKHNRRANRSRGSTGNHPGEPAGTFG
jgi:uncharacterized membrane protein YbhN (UPF0104 family)